MFVQPEEETQSALRTWGGQHTGLWAALVAAGRAIEIVVVGRNVERLAVVGRLLNGWVATPAAVDAHCEAAAARVAEQVRRDEEIASLQKAVATLDHAVPPCAPKWPGSPEVVVGAARGPCLATSPRGR